ncbi:MAG: LptF/LptG family permease [Bacteriovoracaceae bacterium]|nr:LptF/LptG family permease [Bacteriovoracaceae bacterium]
MNIISRIFIFEWFKSLIGALAALLMLISTADIINGFLRGKDASLVLLEWMLKMPELSGKMLPVTCMIATLFSFNKLKSHNELIAALSAGFSHTRITVIIALCSIFMVFVQFTNLGFIEPWSNKIERQEISKSKTNDGKYLTRSAVDGGQFWFKSKNYYSTFLTFDKKDSTLNEIKFYFISPEGTNTKIISAKQARFLQNNTWKLLDVSILDDLSTHQFPKLNSYPSQEIELNETPTDFGEFEADLTTLSWFKLNDFIKKISKTGLNTTEYKILLHQKLALSFSCLVFALIPLGSQYKPNRRSDSFGKNVVFTLVLTVLFWLLFSAALSFGQSGKLPFWLAAYIVPVLFMTHSVWTYFRNRKLAF